MNANIMLAVQTHYLYMCLLPVQLPLGTNRKCYLPAPFVSCGTVQKTSSNVNSGCSFMKKKKKKRCGKHITVRMWQLYKKPSRKSSYRARQRCYGKKRKEN